MDSAAEYIPTDGRIVLGLTGISDADYNTWANGNTWPFDGGYFYALGH